ncbi:arylsulfatase [Erythrobacter sp. SG61-1L]|uniref:arylsulfatase n=1 Tax=Erythrobacter sp. SG61-1L TaxID=1603897 RepID=UPI000B31106D|nr:arylsulfatase [Erythrobacter sp. SG61-1L]
MRTLIALAASTALASISGLALAQSAPAQRPVLPLPDKPYEGTLGRTVDQSSAPTPNPPVKAPAGAPNVILIMTDDTGFGSAATFGGPVPMPNLEALAESGLIYNRFHTTALCSPTRAALLTGRNHHSVGFGTLSELATGYPGYSGVLPRSAATIGEVLKQNGYSTAWFGKNHNTPQSEITPTGPFDRWPTGLGFEEFYGFMGGETDPTAPILYHNTQPVDPSLGKADYFLDKDLADHAVQWMKLQHSIAPDKPFLLYYAPGTSHSPIAAPEDWIAKFHGQFDQGWDKVREETFARQKAAGIIPADTKLTARPPEIPAWDSLSADQQKVAARMMESYAAALAYCDDQIGRIFAELRKSGEMDNTIVIFIEGDNGSSGDGSLNGSTNEVMTQNGVHQDTAAMLADYDGIGTARTQTQIPAPWSWAMDAPFQWTKQVASHFGGTRNGLVVSWPARIKADGKVRSQFSSVIDIAPTLYDAIGIAAPAEVNGAVQMPLQGFSLVPTFADAGAPELHTTQYFEMMGNRAIYKDGWMASTHPLRLPWTQGKSPRPDDFQWELYDLRSDYSQASDLAAKMPAKLKEMQEAFYEEAAKYDALPIDSRGFDRLQDPKTYRPKPRTNYVLERNPFWYEGGAWPDVKNKSWTMATSITVESGAAQGMIAGQGGRFCGWGLYLIGGKPVFLYRYSHKDADATRIAGAAALAPGKHRIELKFAYDGGYGKGGEATIVVDGQAVASGRIAATVPAWIAEPGTIGRDVGTSLSDEYALPFSFEGEIDAVEFDLAPR